MTKVSDNEVFITRVSAAKQGPVFAQRLLLFARHPETERRTRLSTLVHDCHRINASRDFISAFNYLGDKKVARNLCELRGS